jgi:nicotinamide-nucleotide amidase
MTRAALIAVGSELLRFDRADTNTSWISIQLDRLGVEIVARVALPDEPAVIAATLRAALELADLVILTGGLGPTADDRTREGLAQALDRVLEHDAEKEQEMQRRFAAIELPWSERQARQAQRPAGARWIANAAGSADGLLLDHEGTTIVALPGVPSEMQPMLAANIENWVGVSARRAMVRSTLRVFGSGEAVVEAKVSDLYGEPGIDVTVLSAPGEVEIGLQSSDVSRATALRRLEATRAAMLARLGPGVYVDDDRSLSGIIGDLLAERGETLAAAESCTGGALAAEATTVPGSSRWFRGGWVVYADELKRQLAGVEPAMLERDGAVSEVVARRLAEAVRERCGADWGIGITGIAGPGGGSEDKPVGLVHIALASRESTQHWRTVRPGDRQGVRRGSVVFAFERLRRALTGSDL